MKHIDKKEISKRKDAAYYYETQEDFKYQKFMCEKGCQFWVDNLCTKQRIKRICAKKGLKNKE